jgi:hypothetical protein
MPAMQPPLLSSAPDGDDPDAHVFQGRVFIDEELGQDLIEEVDIQHARCLGVIARQLSCFATRVSVKQFEQDGFRGTEHPFSIRLVCRRVGANIGIRRCDPHERGLDLGVPQAGTVVVAHHAEPHERPLPVFPVDQRCKVAIGPAVLDDFLTEAGAFAPSDARADARKTFDAKAWQHVLDEIPTLVGPIALRKEIGATLAELNGLKADSVLVPRTNVATIKSPWRIADGQALLEELEAYARNRPV